MEPGNKQPDAREVQVVGFTVPVYGRCSATQHSLGTANIIEEASILSFALFLTTCARKGGKLQGLIICMQNRGNRTGPPLTMRECLPLPRNLQLASKIKIKILEIRSCLEEMG